MKRCQWSLANICIWLIVSFVLVASSCNPHSSQKQKKYQGEPGKSEKHTFSFDEPSGNSLDGWKVSATNPRGKLAEWKMMANANPVSGPNVLALTKIHDTHNGVFNLYYTKTINFRDGELQIKVRANTGEVDQGGGPIWRVRDENNYYIARYNPLEENFRLYYVKEGARKQLASASGIEIKAGEWFTIKISHRGDQIECWLNGKKYLEYTDSTFQDAGGVGFWTKADAVTSFDDFSVTVESWE